MSSALPSVSDPTSSSSSNSSSSSSSGSSLSSNTERVLERGASGNEANQGNSRQLPRSDSARDTSGVIPVSGGFMFDPSAQMPQTSVRHQIEVPSLIDEEITPPPRVRSSPGNRSSFPGYRRARRRPKKPRQINSFSSSTSRFDDAFMRRPSSRRACGFLCPDFWSPIARRGDGYLSIDGALSSELDRFIPFVPFPEEYTRYKDQLRRKIEVPWTEVLEKQRQSWSLGPQERFSESSEANEGTMDEGELPSLFEEEENQHSGEGVRPTPTTVPECASVRTRGSSEDGENPRVKRARVERPPAWEDGSGVVLGDGADATEADVARTEGFEGEPNAADATEVAPLDGTGGSLSSSSLPYFKAGEFSFRLSKDNPHGFEFNYDGEGAFLNNEEGCAGLQHLLVETHDEARPPTSLVFEAEIASLARMEQRVAYRRTKLAYDYERRLASSEEAKTVVEKERDEARTEVQELKEALRLAKREKRVQKLKDQLEKVELDRTKIREELEVASSSLPARDSELDLSRKAEADLSSELELLRKRYEDMVIRDGHEFVRLCRSRSEYVDDARDQFARLHEESRSRLAKLRDYLVEQEAKNRRVVAVPEVSSRDESGRVEGESSRGDQGDGSEPGGDDGLVDAADELAQD
ncbi:unnamed protein product [Cochlearia groenlandica]